MFGMNPPCVGDLSDWTAKNFPKLEQGILALLWEFDSSVTVSLCVYSIFL